MVLVEGEDASNHFLVWSKYFLYSLSKRIKTREMREGGVWNKELQDKVTAETMRR